MVMLYILFDTNLVVTKTDEGMYYFQTSEHFRNICWQYKERSDVAGLFSEMVKEEMVRQQMGRLRDMINTLRRFQSYLPPNEDDEIEVQIAYGNRLNLSCARGSDEERDFYKRCEDSIRKAYEKMRSLLGLRDLRYTGDAEHERGIFRNVTTRALYHQKPFPPEGDKGFKDAVILETVRNFMVGKNSDMFLFFTRNANDFKGVSDLPENIKIHIIEDGKDGGVVESQVNAIIRGSVV